MLVGECGCGTVRYRVADAFLYALNCHCSRCRGATGSAFKAFAGIEREKLELADGLDALLVGDDVAFASALLRCGSEEELTKDPDNRLRLTIGLRKEGGRWVVAHEHHSFPARD